MVITRGVIYGLDVYSFNSCVKTPYQLTVDSDNPDHPDYNVVTLVNLLALEKNKFCKELREGICDTLFSYLRKSNKPLFFDITLTDSRKDLLLIKFLRWLSCFDNSQCLDTYIEFTKYQEVFYVEVIIKLQPNYQKLLPVDFDK